MVAVLSGMVVSQAAASCQGGSGNGNALAVSAFNVQIFGLSKMDDPGVPEILVGILERYHLTLFQEIRDASETAIYELMAMLEASAAPRVYNISLSPRLGRTSSKEQYAYIYDSGALRVVDSSCYVYDDGEEGSVPPTDTFQREPYVCTFETVAEGWRFAVAGIHTDPDEAVYEVGNLTAVYDDWVANRGGSDGEAMLIMGDFNADCSYVTASEMEDLAFRHDPRFTWLVPDAFDTTVSGTDCAYDRAVANTAMAEHVDNSSVSVFRFDLELGLDQMLTEEVSDHYPVDMVVCPPPNAGDSLATLTAASTVTALVALLLAT